jgi:O-antigen/teichoic acid export membrane protein
MSTVRNKIINVIERVHLWIFGHEMSGIMRKFLYNLSWSFFGVLFSAFIFFIVNILAGRLLGPAGYGDYNLVISIATFSSVFIALGFDTATIRFVAASDDEKKIKKYISNALLAILIVSAIYLVFGLIFRTRLASVLKTTDRLITIALIYAIVYTLKNLMDGIAKAMQMFKRQMIIKIVESILVLALFSFFFFLLNQRSYFQYVLSLILGASVLIILFYYPIRDAVPRWDRQVFSEIKKYQRTVIFIGFIGITVATVDKFVVAKMLGVAELGLYSAYMVTSMAVISQITLLINNVFFPMVNKVAGKRQIMEKIDRLGLFMFLPLVAFSALISYVIIKLFGSQYEVNLMYMLLVGMIAFGQTLCIFYGSIISSSENFLHFNARIYYFKPLFIGLLYYLAYTLHQFNLYSVFLIVISSYIFDFINTKITLKLVKE